MKTIRELAQEEKNAVDARYAASLANGIGEDFPLDDDETGATKGGKKSLATRTVKIAEEEVEELFHDQHGEPWARFKIGDHYEHYPLEGRPVRDLISKFIWEQEGTAIYREALKAATAVLSAKARFEGNGYLLHTRCAWHEGAIWVDLSNDKWQAVKITPQGWEVVDNPPILFRRFPHQRPMEVGTPQETLDLNQWLNVKEEDDRVLLHVWLVTDFIPEIPHPVVIFHGPQGSAKTTHSKMIKAIVDPQEAEVLSVPRDVGELAQVLMHHHLCVFDNLSSLPGWISDSLSRAVSGDGFSKRKLYTDSDDIVFRYRRCLVLNGINVVATRPDLLDRSIIMELDRLRTMKTEEEVWGGFSEALPDIRATIFSTLARAMEAKSNASLGALPRMADFAMWGHAAASVMEIEKNLFLRIYHSNIGRQFSLIIEDSPIASALVAFMENREEWKGQPGDLLQELAETAEYVGINTKGKGWPSQPNGLTRQLRRLKITLEAVGLGVEDWRDTNRWLRVFKIGEKDCRHGRTDGFAEISGTSMPTVADGPVDNA
jgi:hypothetical protein